MFFECCSLDWIKIHRLFATLEHPPHIEYQIDNLETAKKLVASGMGVSFLPDLCVRQEVKDGLLVPIHIPALGGLSLRTNLISLKETANDFTHVCLEASDLCGRGHRQRHLAIIRCCPCNVEESSLAASDV